MTDYIADLETELVAAARRRARRRVPRPRLVPVVAAVAIVVAVLAVVRGVDGSRPADERPVTPPTGGGVPVTLPAAQPVRDEAGCRAGVDASLALQPQFAVFDRPQTANDRALPRGFGALPADFVDKGSLRQAGGGEHELRLIRVGGLSGPCRGAEARPVDGGVCLIAGVEHVATRCFPDEAIVRGTALAAIPVRAVPTDWVYGIAPNGVDSVRLTWSAGAVTAPVVDNGYAAQLRGVKPGDEVRVELVPASGSAIPHTSPTADEPPRPP